MLKKTLLTAVAALALTTGAATLAAPEANAGFKHHHHKFHHFKKYHHFKHHCYKKYKYVKVGYWTKWGYVYKYVWKPIKICY